MHIVIVMNTPLSEGAIRNIWLTLIGALTLHGAMRQCATRHDTRSELYMYQTQVPLLSVPTNSKSGACGSTTELREVQSACLFYLSFDMTFKRAWRSSLSITNKAPIASTRLSYRYQHQGSSPIQLRSYFVDCDKRTSFTYPVLFFGV